MTSTRQPGQQTIYGYRPRVVLWHPIKLYIREELAGR